MPAVNESLLAAFTRLHVESSDDRTIELLLGAIKVLLDVSGERGERAFREYCARVKS